MFEVEEQDCEVTPLSPLYTCLNHEFSWLRQFDFISCEEKLSELVAMAIDTQNNRSSIEQNLNSLLDSFYSDWAFSGTSQKVPVSMLNSIAYTLHYRTGSNISIGLILVHIMEQLGLDVELMVFENDIQVLLKVSSVEGYPVSYTHLRAHET